MGKYDFTANNMYGVKIPTERPVELKSDVKNNLSGSVISPLKRAKLCLVNVEHVFIQAFSTTDIVETAQVLL